MFDAPGKLTIGELEVGYPLLQGFETTSPAGKSVQDIDDGVLGPSGNPESLFAHPLQVTSIYWL